MSIRMPFQLVDPIIQQERLVILHVQNGPLEKTFDCLAVLVNRSVCDI